MMAIGAALLLPIYVVASTPGHATGFPVLGITHGLGLVTVAAAPSDGTEFLRQGTAFYDDLEWRQAETALVTAVERGLDSADLVDAYWHLALTAYARSDTQAAEEYLFTLLRTDPRFELPDTVTGTDFVPLFGRAQARTDREPPEITDLRTSEPSQGKPVRVSVAVADDSPLTQVVLAFRLPRALNDTIEMMEQAGDRWSGEIPEAATRNPGSVAFRVVATDDWGNDATQNGTVVISKPGGGHGVLYTFVGTVVGAGVGIAAAYFAGVDLPIIGGADSDDDDTVVDPTWPNSASPGTPE